MTIRDWDKFKNGIWDFACLDGCWGGTRISPTDVDGLVERNGKFLYLEAKSPGARPTKGQEITFAALSRNPDNTVLVWEGDSTTQDVKRITVYVAGEAREVPRPSLEQLRKCCAKWFKVANGNKT